MLIGSLKTNLAQRRFQAAPSRPMQPENPAAIFFRLPRNLDYSRPAPHLTAA
nr:hypothetical protein [uncultured Kingella sp.]